MPIVLRLGCYIVDRDKNHFVIHSEIPNEPIQEANTAPTTHDSPDRSARPRTNASTMFVTSLLVKLHTQPRDVIRHVSQAVVQRRLRTSLYLPPLATLNNMAQREIALEEEMAAIAMETLHEPGRSPRKVVHIVPQSPSNTGGDFSSVGQSNTATPSRGLFTGSMNDANRSGWQQQHGDDTISLLDTPAAAAVAAAAAAHPSPSKSPRHRFSLKGKLKLFKKGPASPSSPGTASGTTTVTGPVFTKDTAKSKDLCLCIADCDGVFHYCGSLQKVAPRSSSDAVNAERKNKHPDILKMPFVAEACTHSHELFMRRCNAAHRLLLPDGSDSPSADRPSRAQMRAKQAAKAGESQHPSIVFARRGDTRPQSETAETPAEEEPSREAEDERVLAQLRLSFNNSLFNSDETGPSLVGDAKLAFLVGVVVPLTLLRALNPLETVGVSMLGGKEPASENKKQKKDSSSGQVSGIAASSSNATTTKLYKKVNARRRFKLFEQVKVPKELSDFTFIQESSNAPLPRQRTSSTAREQQQQQHHKEDAVHDHHHHGTKESSDDQDVPVEGETPLTAPPYRATTGLMTTTTTTNNNNSGTVTAGTTHVSVHQQGNSTILPSNDDASATAAIHWRSPVGDPSTYICAEDGATNVQLVTELKAEEDHVRAELAAAILAYKKVKKLFDSTAFSFGIPEATTDRALVGQDPEVYQLMREKIELSTRLTLQQQHLDQQVDSETRMLEMQLMHVQDEINESRMRQEKLSAIAVTNSSHVY